MKFTDLLKTVPVAPNMTIDIPVSMTQKQYQVWVMQDYMLKNCPTIADYVLRKGFGTKLNDLFISPKEIDSLGAISNGFGIKFRLMDIEKGAGFGYPPCKESESECHSSISLSKSDFEAFFNKSNKNLYNYVRSTLCHEISHALYIFLGIKRNPEAPIITCNDINEAQKNLSSNIGMFENYFKEHVTCNNAETILKSLNDYTYYFGSIETYGYIFQIQYEASLIKSTIDVTNFPEYFKLGKTIKIDDNYNISDCTFKHYSDVIDAFRKHFLVDKVPRSEEDMLNNVYALAMYAEALANKDHLNGKPTGYFLPKYLDGYFGAEPSRIFEMPEYMFVDIKQKILDHMEFVYYMIELRTRYIKETQLIL